MPIKSFKVSTQKKNRHRLCLGDYLEILHQYDPKQKLPLGLGKAVIYYEKKQIILEFPTVENTTAGEMYDIAEKLTCSSFFDGDSFLVAITENATVCIRYGADCIFIKKDEVKDFLDYMLGKPQKTYLARLKKEEQEIEKDIENHDVWSKKFYKLEKDREKLEEKKKELAKEKKIIQQLKRKIVDMKKNKKK